MISVGDTLPEANFLRLGSSGPEEVSLASLVNGTKVVLFGLPGAYTGTCTTAHVPSFIRAKDALAEKGFQHVICVSVNDPFVMDAWGKATGATEAGIKMLSDADGAFTRAMGLAFTAPPAGFYDRSRRYALVAENGKISVLHTEENPGVCDMSAGEAILDQL